MNYYIACDLLTRQKKKIIQRIDDFHAQWE